jgi:hypothetical protein
MKKSKLFIPIMLLCMVFAQSAKSQVLISLLLGDKLNSPNLEFGLDGGGNLLNMSNTPKDSGSSVNADWLNNWNLGFYFDFKLKKQPKWGVHTGVFVKGSMGTNNITPYSLDNKNLDSAFIGGTVDRKINYFNVPILIRYSYYKTLFVQGGIQAGLRYTGNDYFQNSVNDNDDLKFTNDVKDNFARLDFGGFVGLGYKFTKGPGMTIHIDYYNGLVDANKTFDGKQYNQAFYFNASIPIGKKKAARAAAEKEQSK